MASRGVLPSHDRTHRILSLDRYAWPNPPLEVGAVELAPPVERQMVLRMLVSAPYSFGLRMPESIRWTAPLVEAAAAYQSQVGVSHPFVYVTVRHGQVDSKTDDEWHVDGFSMRYSHLPEANYVWSSQEPTEWLAQQFVVPMDFDPLRHNLHSWLQTQADERRAVAMRPGVAYFVDPYVVHRRPPGTRGKWRTFVRVSHTPIEIPDPNNTPNPLIRTDHYLVDGIRCFRDGLVAYTP